MPHYIIKHSITGEQVQHNSSLFGLNCTDLITIHLDSKLLIIHHKMLPLQNSSRFGPFLLAIFVLFAFLARDVRSDEYQIPIPGSEMASEEMQDEIVPVYSLTKLTTAEEDLIITAISTAVDEGDNLPWVKAKIVPWTGDAEGNIDDLYRLYRKMRDDTDKWRGDFFFFIDRQCIEEKQVIVAQPDYYTLLYASSSTAELNEILRKHGSKISEMNEGIVEKVMPELLERALTYGRLPAHALSSTWANLDIGNMDMFELVESYEVGKVELYYNPDWDVNDFLKKAEIADAELKEEEGQTTGGQE